ncbi:hypothetical protein [Rubritalea tangerina]|uniref:hypothetical protein n=1 Tax=Rubritalea tangerina TaxID=430798 RepID=UPI0036183FA2
MKCPEGTLRLTRSTKLTGSPSFSMVKQKSFSSSTIVGYKLVCDDGYTILNISLWREESLRQREEWVGCATCLNVAHVARNLRKQRKSRACGGSVHWAWLSSFCCLG